MTWQPLRFRAVAAILALAALAGGGAAIAQADASAGGGETLSSTDAFATGANLIRDREALPGAALYGANCAMCHNGGLAKAPHRQWLELLAPAAIVRSLTSGVMAAQGSRLSAQEKLQIAEYLTRVPVSKGLPKVSEAPRCTGAAAAFDRTKPIVTTGWGHDSARFVPAALGGMTAADLPRLELKWAYAFPYATKARSQPAIGMGAVFVGGEDGLVQAFDLASGCVRWSFEASGEVRTGIVLTGGVRPMLYFGDILGRAYALDALTGAKVWAKRIADHPSATLTATPLYADGRLYVPVSSLEVVPAADPAYPCCSFRGQMAALDALTGEEVWRFYAIPDAPKQVGTTRAGTSVLAPSGAPMWATPTLDTKRGVLYAGTGENYSSPADGNSDSLFAIDITTGKAVWHRQTISGDAWNVACMMKGNPNCPAENGPDFDHSSSAMLVDLGEGRELLIAGHKNGTVYALDPDRQGALVWQSKVGRGSIQGGVHFGMATEATTLYVPINDMNNLRDGKVMDAAAARPGMHAISAGDGRLLWSKLADNRCGEKRPYCDPGISAAVTAIPGAVIAGHLDGWIRAYARDSGVVLWEFDTARDFTTINAMPGRGGSMSGPGAAVGDGYLAINSGYGLYSHEAGNVLLVFAPKR